MEEELIDIGEGIILEKKRGIVWVHKNVYCNQIIEGIILLDKDLKKISSFKKQKPKSWRKIHRWIENYICWITDKSRPLDSRADAFSFYLKERKLFEHTLGKYHPTNVPF